MCKNATATAASLMKAIEPTLVQLLTLENLATTPQGVAVIDAFNAAQAALASWTPGTAAETAVQAINAFNSVFDVLPVPTEAKALASIISAGIDTVIGIISANSPAPATATNPASEEVVAHPEVEQAEHVSAVVSSTTTKVQAKVPGFKRSIFTPADKQYKNAWNKQVDAQGGKFATLKQ